MLTNGLYSWWQTEECWEGCWQKNVSSKVPHADGAADGGGWPDVQHAGRLRGAAPQPPPVPACIPPTNKKKIWLASTLLKWKKKILLNPFYVYHYIVEDNEVIMIPIFTLVFIIHIYIQCHTQ